MIDTVHKQHVVKRYAKLVLALFVLSVINLSFQLPAHASMLQNMNQKQMAVIDMVQMDMQDCHCPPALCETVVSLDDQSVEGLQSISFENLLSFYPVLVNIIDVNQHHQVSVHLEHHNWQYRQISPPPLSFTTILHI